MLSKISYTFIHSIISLQATVVLKQQLNTH